MPTPKHARTVVLPGVSHWSSRAALDVRAEFPKRQAEGGREFHGLTAGRTVIILSELRSITMPDDENHVSGQPERTPWNKGKLIGPKPPLGPKHVWSIRTRLRVEGRSRDLGAVQCGHPQQAARLRRCRACSRARCS